MSNEKTDPNLLFDTIKSEAGISSDYKLARSIGTAPSNLSNMRRGRLMVGPALIIRIMENHHMPLARIKRLLAGLA